MGLRDGRTEDRTRDWICNCGERNFARRFECHLCGGRRELPNIREMPGYKRPASASSRSSSPSVEKEKEKKKKKKEKKEKKKKKRKRRQVLQNLRVVVLMAKGKR